MGDTGVLGLACACVFHSVGHDEIKKGAMMVNFKFFADAKYIYECSDVFFLDAGEHHARFLVAGKQVRIETTQSGTKFICECEHHMRHQLQDKLCKRVIAVLIYIYFKRGRLNKR